jgi:hypothetical protein
LEQVEVNIEGVKTKVDFEVIEIMDDSDPYPALLGIDWAFDNNAMLNLKKRHMSFEIDTLHVITPLDLNEGDRYNEPMDEDEQSSVIENIYKITWCREDYINPIADGELSWQVSNLMTLILKMPWKGGKKLYEVSTRRCMHISAEVHEEEFGSYRYNGSDPVDTFISWIQHISNITGLMPSILCS